MNTIGRAVVGLAVAALAASACVAGTEGIGGQGGGTSRGFQLAAPSDPTTCEDAAAQRGYIGCDFWPTVGLNRVWSIFDYAVVIANVGTAPSDVTVAFAGQVLAQTTVGPSQVVKLLLPWVPELKGPDADTCGLGTSATASVVQRPGAYHLTSSHPIVAYQFSALEYEGKGGADKDWSACPGYQACADQGPVGCFSFTNDASLLLPSTAMTGNYRAAGHLGKDTYLEITGTVDGTTVRVRGGAGASFLAGGSVKAIGPNGVATFTLDAGDVAELIATTGSDLSGSLVTADAPVQVLTGASCSSVTDLEHVGDATCDHLEEFVAPAETLGKHYLLTAPTGPLGTPDPYFVRVVGNVNGTTLSYPNGAPSGAPTTLEAGEVKDLPITDGDLDLVASNEIVVSLLMTSKALANPENFLGQGDPSQSQAIPVEQYRNSYVFLAPDDYDVSYIDVAMPLDAKVTLDGAPLPASPTPIGSSGFGVARVRLGSGLDGAHSLNSDKPVGVQVLGYGSFTSYQYPAGLNLAYIAPPPL